MSSTHRNAAKAIRIACFDSSVLNPDAFLLCAVSHHWIHLSARMISSSLLKATSSTHHHVTDSQPPPQAGSRGPWLPISSYYSSDAASNL